MKRKKIAFIVPYPKGIAPSQRFRFEQYLSLLEQDGCEISFYPFFTDNAYRLIYQPGKFMLKSWGVFIAFFKRFLLMFQLKSYAIVFIHREASPVGPPVFEWIIARVLKKKIIYDFDDAIWLENTSQSNKLISGIKKHSKVVSICRWSTVILCGNHYLMNFAKKYNNDVKYMPTTIDLKNGHNQLKQHKRKEKIVLGWTGTHSTIKYLYEIEDVLFELQKKYDVEVNIISNKEPVFKKLNFNYIPWEKEKEIEDLLSFDIGIMPLLDNEWAKGKCGFKALQYMALGIPAVVSPVGVNVEIIRDGINGYIVNDDVDWLDKISRLIEIEGVRKEIGLEGHKTILSKYSVEVNKKKYLEWIDNLFKK